VLIDSHDQVRVIVGKLPTLQEEDLGFISSKHTLKYLSSIIEKDD
jgi:hypothetical protein